MSVSGKRPQQRNGDSVLTPSPMITSPATHNQKTPSHTQMQTKRPAFRQPLYKKVALGGVSESQVNRWNEVNADRPFEAGLDKGLRSWAALRRSLAAVETGEVVPHETIPARIKYRSGLTYYGDTLRDLWYPKRPVVEGEGEGDGEKKVSNGNVEVEEDEEEEEEAERPTTVGVKPSSAAPLVTVPSQVTILDPTFPALSVAAFRLLLRTAPPREVLLTAYHHFHWRYFDEALAAGLDINMRINSNGKTLLFMAVQNGDTERVEYLLENGANPNVKDHRNDTPLHLCMDHPIVFHPRRIATLLINKGAQVNAANLRGTTPLHRAVLMGFTDFVELLLRRKAKVYCFDASGCMPYQYADKASQPKVAKLFNANVRFCGKRQHDQMWAHIMSRQFIEGIFKLCAPACVVCKRRQHDCLALKTKDFRYWLYVHEVLAVQKKAK